MTNGRGRIAKVAAAVLLLCTAIAGAALAGMAANAATKTTKAIKIKVTEKEYKISLSKHSFKTGQKVTFMVSNRGKVAHEFAIKGPGLNKRISGKLQPGAKKTLTVTLKKKGKYMLECPIHLALGMKTAIHTTGSSSGGGGTTTSGGGTTTGGGGWG